MKAIAIIPGTRTVTLIDRPEPAITTPDAVKLRVLQVGICGTDIWKKCMRMVSRTAFAKPVSGLSNSIH